MATPFGALERYARLPSARAQAARCELCGAEIGEQHAHVVELARHALACACSACAVLFRDRNSGGGRYRTVPDRVLAVAGFAPSDAAWSALGIPVRMAFLVRRSDGWMAYFPSPGGPVEAELSDAAARALVALVPLADAVEPDVEALLFNRPRGGAAECFVVPLDVCHALSAVVRKSWRGFSGGDEAEAIEGFFAGVRARSRR